MQVIVKNLATTYSSTGKGDVILCLHGWQDSSQTFTGLAKDFGDKYQVIAVDLPGFGSTQTPQQDWHVQDYADFIVAFCEKLDIKPAYIVAHSMGARITIRLLAQKALTPKKVVLLGAAGISESKSAKQRLIQTLAKSGQAATSLPGMGSLQAKLRQKFRRAAGATDYAQAGALQQTFVNLVNEDLQADAARITTPTLLIYGEQDQETPTQYGEIFHKAIKNSQLLIMPGAGHFVHHDKGDETETAIKEFLG